MTSRDFNDRHDDADESSDERGRLPVSRRSVLQAAGAAGAIGGASGITSALSDSNTVSVGSGSYTTEYPGDSTGDMPPTTDELRITDNVDQPIPTNGVWSGMHFAYDPYDETWHEHCNGATVTYPYYADARSEGFRLQIPSTWQGWRDPWDDMENQPAAIEEADFVRMDYQETPRLVIGNTDVSSYADTRTHDHGDWFNTARWGDGTTAPMDVTQVRGCPFVFVEYGGGGADLSLLDETDAALSNANVSVFADQGNVLGLTVEPTQSGHSVQHFGLYAPDGASWSGVGTSSLTSQLAGSGYLTVAVLPDGTESTLDAFEQYAYNFVRDTTVDWNYDEANAAVSTTYAYTLEEKAESTTSGTLSALFPTQWKHTSASFTGDEYWSPRGRMKVVAGSSFSTTLRYPGILPVQPDVGTYDGAQLDQYLQDLRSDYGPYTDQGVPACAYWSGKDFMRNTQVAPIADVRGLTAEQDYFLQALRGRLSTYLDVANNAWTVDGDSFSTADSDEVFYFHDDLGVLQSYPDCEFGGAFAVNDHHFHYGYLVNAAAEVARQDPKWADNYGPMVELLIRDYANWERPDTSNPLDPSTYPKDSFPFLRTFEPYAGMSYAGGINGNDYGNNQESSSEAIAAYAAMVKWGEITGNTELRDAGIWMYTHEVNASREYWFDEVDDSLPANFGSNLGPDELDTEGSGPFKYCSQTWDVGSWRQVYWDTSDPIELYGINNLPIGGHSFYLGYDQTYNENNWDRLLTARDQLVGGPDPYSRWPDGWAAAAWCYRAMSNPSRAIDPNMAGEMPISPTGTSSPYVYYFLHHLNEIGIPDPTVSADTPFYQVFQDSSTGTKTYVAYNASSSTTTVNFSDGTSLDVAANSVGYTTGSGGSSSAPTVDSLSASEVETSDSDAEFDVSWSVGDSDGDLSSVDLTLTDDGDGTTEDSASISVSGSSASGTTRLVAAGDDGTGNSYTLELVATDGTGNTASSTTSVTESEDTSSGNAPTVDSFSISEDNSGGSPHAEFQIDYAVSDADGDLSSVDLTLTDTEDGQVEGSTTVSVSGSSGSGTETLSARKAENDGHTYEAECVVTDANGNTDTATATEVEDGS
ncbi:glycoside hydrolase family 81 [Salinarchaeum sp. Harcht-Bsk1]|uniref:glycosyl hydrolase n=1 Tax=Salinarchaeum sp. Harcht-Bsk1 TaxID=1333523 RepID=UPI00034230A9|nr:glycosyl hydrolase [Salinarchaeum sp. Harcht-Bsk1]AGN01975.1 glycoside hydrolase family 81 [Salinarchaeum sp. Harcht-Bsk1]